jgi:hypothetical protein
MTEQAKSQRVAVSFRLWGDPEVTIFPKLPEKPRAAAIAARWTAPQELTIHVPAQRLPEVRSDRFSQWPGISSYTARLFPGSEVAGLVKKKNGTPLRRVLPAYYFRMPLVGSGVTDRMRLADPGGSNQAAFRRDPLGRFLYVVYLPNVEQPRSEVVLHWVNR